MNAYEAILEALIARGRTGEGAEISVSMFDGMASRDARRNHRVNLVQTNRPRGQACKEHLGCLTSNRHFDRNRSACRRV
jgi:crotonobetainyl-CoA:carnitine CoA-transferase CaiB-like acyl-CoA transferase